MNKNLSQNKKDLLRKLIIKFQIWYLMIAFIKQIKISIRKQDKNFAVNVQFVKNRPKKNCYLILFIYLQVKYGTKIKNIKYYLK